MSELASENCKELWREGDFYSPSIYVNDHGGIGINVGGYVIVKPVRIWHAEAAAHDQLEKEKEVIIDAANKLNERCLVLEKALREIEQRHTSAAGVLGTDGLIARKALEGER